MFDEFDFNHDGELDAAESAYMHDTLCGEHNESPIIRTGPYIEGLFLTCFDMEE